MNKEKKYAVLLSFQFAAEKEFQYSERLQSFHLREGEDGDGFTEREGYTVAWVGWEFDVA